MGYNLGVPGKMSVRAVVGAEGERYVEFCMSKRAANSPVRFDVEEVRKLIIELDHWCRAAAPPAREGVVMWGVWFKVDDDEYRPPTALFGREEEAKAFATLMHAREWDISPCIVDLKTRDDFEIPEPEAAS